MRRIPESVSWMQSPDRLVASLALGAAATLDGRPSIRESDLEEAVATFARHFEIPIAKQKTVKLAGWNGRIGPVDLVVGADDETVAVELKWSHKTLAACAWDALKLACVVAEGHAPSACLIAGAPTALWSARGEGTALFTSRSWSSTLILTEYQRWFDHWRREVDNHPGDIPAYWSTRSVPLPPVSRELSVDDVRYEIRAARIVVP